MGLFSKKFCDVCGNKIGLLGNRKLEDGNLCKDCAKKLSPWFSERRHSTLSDIKAQLQYREENKEKAAAFRATKTLGIRTKLMIDAQKRQFMVAKTSDIAGENPDVLDFSQARGCEFVIDEDRDEKMLTREDGSEVSYNPPRYEYSYTMKVRIFVDHPYFDEMDFDISNGYINTGETRMNGNTNLSVNRTTTFLHGADIQKYNDTVALGNEIKAEIERMQRVDARVDVQDNVPTENQPYGVESPQQVAAGASWVCPFCDHPANTGNFCEACGAKRPS